MADLREIRITVTEESFQELKDVKGKNRSWRDAMLEEFGVRDTNDE